MIEHQFDIRDELFSDQEDEGIFENHQYIDSLKNSNSEMLNFFIDMNSTFELIEFERWLLKNE